jgi:effector-binding domain-containing protein
VKGLLFAMFPAVLALLGPVDAMAAEEAPYDVLKQDGKFEIREYASHILAETVVEGDLEEAGNKAFSRLFAYISGENTSRDKIAMTSPVSQQPAGEKIAMTAPVSQQSTGDSWAVSFMMPEAYSMETLPEPADPLVSLRQVPPRTMAAVRYSGFWSEENYQKHKAELEDWMAAMDLVSAGEPVWARYNAPFTPWFLRRNEILVPLEAGSGG